MFVDFEIGEILVEKGQILDRRILDKVLLYLENGIGFRKLYLNGGVVEDEVIF